MFELIRTAPVLESAIQSTYLYGLIIAVAYVLIFIIVANLISWEGGDYDRSGIRRRVALFVILAILLISSALFNYFAWYVQIAVPAFATRYLTHMLAAPFASAVAYFLLCFVIIKICRIGSKLNSVFPKKDR